MPTLTEAQWKQVEPFLKNMKPQRRLVTYNRLVRGMTLLEAGQAHGYRTSEVALITRAVLKWHAKLTRPADRPEPPLGWVNVEFWIPAHRVDDVRRVVEALCPTQPPVPAAATRPVRQPLSHVAGACCLSVEQNRSPNATPRTTAKRK